MFFKVTSSSVQCWDAESGDGRASDRMSGQAEQEVTHPLPGIT